jgi:hypothetical protein
VFRRPALLEDFNEGKFDCGRHIGRRFPGDRDRLRCFSRSSKARS